MTRQPDFVYPTVAYELSDVLNDLMEFSAKHLRPGGRLVFWLPVIRDLTYETRIPQHPQLQLISNCEQPFSQCTHLISHVLLLGSRNLLTYVRTDITKSSTHNNHLLLPPNHPEFRDMVSSIALRLLSPSILTRICELDK